MSDSAQLLKALLAVLVGLLVLRAQWWRAVLFVWPTSMKLDAEDVGAPDAVPSALEVPWQALEALGFEPLGTHSERPLGGPPALFHDLVRRADLVFASLSVHGGQPRLTLTSWTEQGFVVTRDFRRATRELEGRYLVGSLEGVGPQRLYRAHQRRVALLGTPKGEVTLEGRVELGRQWLLGPGKSELRLEHGLGLLWAIGGLLVVIAGVHGLRGE